MRAGSQGLIIEEDPAPFLMEDVLMLAHRFPPFGGAAVQRNVQLARHLPAHGYRPIIVTGAATDATFRWTPLDSALSEDDDVAGASVHRLGGDEPDIVTPRSRRWLRLRPRWETWWTEAAVEKAVEVGAEAALVHCSLAPYLTANAAVAVARQLRKPLVVDLEDPWALDDMLTYPTRAHRTLELRRMRDVLGAADIVVMNTAEARHRVLQAFPELAADRVVAIPNAFDPLDFADPAEASEDGAQFRIVHTGSLHTDLGVQQREMGRARRLLGGAVKDVDFLARSHVYLLEAVGAAVRGRPELRGKIEVHLAGVFTNEDRAVAGKYPFVRLHEFLPHSETLGLMQGADLLFLPLYDLPPGRRAAIVPHKTYEYIGSGRPILAAVPDGDAHDLLIQSGAAAVCRPTDVAAMTAALLSDIDAWAAGQRRRSPKPSVVAWCSAPRLVSDLAKVYARIPGRSRTGRIAARRKSIERR